MAASQTGEFPPDPELTLSDFWNRWGADSGFDSQELVQTLWDEAEMHYADLEFHNFDHAKEVLWQTMHLADLCEEHGLNVNRKILIAASLFHDAGYHRDHLQKGFESKEKYSCSILEEHVARLGFSDVEISLASQAVMATKVGTRPVALEEKILVRGDLHTLGEDYFASFLKKTIQLFEEEKRSKETRGEPFSYSVFAASNIQVLATYLSQDLKLGEFDYDWRIRAVGNVRRRIEYLAASNGMRFTEYLKGLGGSALRLFGMGGSDDNNVAYFTSRVVS